MGTARHLSRAPIREAIVDIQIDPPATLEQVARVVDALKDEFPRTNGIWQATFGLQVAEDGTPATQNTLKNQVGTRLENGREPHVIQCRINGFSFSRLTPYRDWGQVRPEAFRLWEIYRDIVKPQVVNRVAVRYINEMELPLPFADFKEYLSAPPEVPAGLPQTLSGFFQRVVMVDTVKDRMAAVSQAFEGAQATETADKITVFLDIDTFSQVAMSADSPDVWDKLDELREFKNNIFFEHLTDKTLELFE